MPVSALHCVANGWHPKLSVVITRMRVHRDRPDTFYRNLLISEAGARDCHLGDHLSGSLRLALDTLRKQEAYELAESIGLGTSPGPGEAPH